MSKIDKLDGQSGNLRITESGDIAWGAVGATTTGQLTSGPIPANPSSSSSICREAGFVDDPRWNRPNEEIVRDDQNIQAAIAAIGGTPNQKIEYQGVLLTDNGDMGSSNVRLYSVGEGDDTKYVGIKQGNGQILSEKQLEVHLIELNKTRTAENKPELNTGIIGDILNKPDQYLNVPEKTEA